MSPLIVPLITVLWLMMTTVTTFLPEKNKPKFFYKNHFAKELSIQSALSQDSIQCQSSFFGIKTKLILPDPIPFKVTKYRKSKISWSLSINYEIIIVLVLSHAYQIIEDKSRYSSVKSTKLKVYRVLSEF